MFYPITRDKLHAQPLSSAQNVKFYCRYQNCTNFSKRHFPAETVSSTLYKAKSKRKISSTHYVGLSGGQECSGAAFPRFLRIVGNSSLGHGETSVGSAWRSNYHGSLCRSRRRPLPLCRGKCLKTNILRAIANRLKRLSVFSVLSQR